MTKTQARKVYESNFMNLKRELLSDHLLFNGITTHFTEDHQCIFYFMNPENAQSSMIEAILKTLESLHFTAQIDRKKQPIEGDFYPPTEGFYAGLPPMHFKVASESAK